MSKTILSDVDGFTPLIDNITRTHGLTTSAVFGRMWRFCQGEHGVCHASLERIGEDLGIDKATVQRHAVKLCELGYLEDTTPGLRNKPHTYRDTGKAALVVKIHVAERNVEPSDQSPTLQPATSRLPVQRHVAESTLKKELKKESEIEEAPPSGGVGSESNQDTDQPPAQEKDQEQAGQKLAKVVLEVPLGGNKVVREAFFEKCPHCQEKITQEHDNCPGCQAEVEWHNSKVADRRDKNRKSQEVDLHARSLREANRQNLPEGAKKLLLTAITVDVGGVAFYKETEARRVQAFVDSYGLPELEKLIKAVRGREGIGIGGRALIVGVMNKMLYHGAGNRGDNTDERPNAVRMV